MHQIVLAVSLVFSFLSALAPVAVAATEPSVDEVLERYFEALGGRERLASVRTILLHGFREQDRQRMVAYRQVYLRPEHRRLEITIGKVTAVQAYDGKEAWMQWPFPPLSQGEPAPMPLDLASEFVQDADFLGPLVDHRRKGHRIELLGVVTLEGHEVYELRVRLAQGGVRTVYLDRSTHLPLRQLMRSEASGMDIAETFLEYRDVKGLKIAVLSRAEASDGQHSVTVTNRVTEVEVDTEIPKELFSMPAATAK